MTRGSGDKSWAVTNGFYRSYGDSTGDHKKNGGFCGPQGVSSRGFHHHLMSSELVVW